MIENSTIHAEPASPSNSRADRLNAPLVERMDPAIGEASSVMGAMVAELIRRSLRGGVLHLGEELGSYVAEQVTSTLKDQTPLIEEVASGVADHTARAAATEVAREETAVLHEKTRAADEQLAVRIEEKATELAGETRQAAATLAAQIEQTEKRVTETARAELTDQIAQLRERSRKGLEVLLERLRGLETGTKDLTRQLAEEQAARAAAEAALRTEVQQRSTALRRELEKQLAQSNRVLREETQALRQTAAELETRLTELEKPRGLRLLWQLLAFWRKKDDAATPAAELAHMPADARESPRKNNLINPHSLQA